MTPSQPNQTKAEAVTPAPDDERSMTVEQVVELFNNTIFWNYLDGWPGDKYKEPEFPLSINEINPDNQDEPLTRSLIFESGECSICVATMHPIREHQDAESGITDYDVEFIQKLPVIIPTLLREIDRLRESRATVDPATVDVAALVAALEPFAVLKGSYSHQPDEMPIIAGANQHDIRFRFTLGDFRRAVSALAKVAKGGSERRGER